ncbi:hypothetical protein CBR_g53519 [Chara braunii]|uniref:Uncharacterized protein n=1 Tax=Chara braunii TaxID=69332 RepID=A0A388MB21_CHABU|nr:hypothetical protein CBR_g53519 [Chara braunii]|eukprot:GBG91705.1 hypothetical protein CBR_g53519 [Chara braunii]
MSQGAEGSGGNAFIPVSDADMAKLRRALCVWKYVTQGQRAGTREKMHGDRKLRCNLCEHVWQGDVSKVIRDGQFWRLLEFVILVMQPFHQLLRRMDNGGMMMSIVYEWSQHLVRLMRQSTVPAELLSPCVREVEMRLMHHWSPRTLQPIFSNPADGLREARDCVGHDETAHCAAWWFAHGEAHPEQHGGGYVLPWIMDDHDDHRRCGAREEDGEDGDPESAAWVARLAGTVSDEELRRQIVVFASDNTTSLREASVVFGERASILLPYDHVPPPAQDAGVEGAQAREEDWTDPEDLALGGDRSAEQVYFTYGRGSDGLAARTSVITDDGLGPTQGVGDEQTLQVIEVDSSGDEPETEERLRDTRFDPSHHSLDHLQLLRQSTRLAGQSGAESQHLEDIPLREHTPITPSHDRDRQDTHDTPSSLWTSDFNIGGSHGGSSVLDTEVGCGPESIGGTGVWPHGDDNDRGTDSDSSDGGDRGEAAEENIVERVIIGVRMADMEGGMSGGRDTSLMGDAVMAEEVGLSTYCRGSDTDAGHSPVMEVGVDADKEARSSPLRDIAGDMPLTLLSARARRHGSISGLEAQIVVERQRLEHFVRERDRLAGTDVHGDEADTKRTPIDIVARRDRDRRAATAAVATVAKGDAHAEPRQAERVASGQGRSGLPESTSGVARHLTRARCSGRS